MYLYIHVLLALKHISPSIKNGIDCNCFHHYVLSKNFFLYIEHENFNKKRYLGLSQESETE